MSDYDYYATLGVGPNASADEIKAAHRRKASKEHPDRGGDADKMAEVNEAYEVLIDPRRRLKYDQTGDGGGKPISQQAKETLTQFFATALEKNAPDILLAARQMLGFMRVEAERDISSSEARLATLSARRDKVKSKGKVNLVHVLIDQAVIDLKAAIDNAREGLEVVAAAELLLADYSVEEARVQTTIWTPVDSVTSWSGTDESEFP